MKTVRAILRSAMKVIAADWMPWVLTAIVGIAGIVLCAIT